MRKQRCRHRFGRSSGSDHVCCAKEANETEGTVRCADVSTAQAFGGQEDTVRIFGVVRERRTVREAEALGYRLRAGKGRNGAGSDEASVRAAGGLDQLCVAASRAPPLRRCVAEAGSMDFNSRGRGALLSGRHTQQYAETKRSRKVQ